MTLVVLFLLRFQHKLLDYIVTPVVIILLVDLIFLPIAIRLTKNLIITFLFFLSWVYGLSEREIARTVTCLLHLKHLIGAGFA